MTHHFPPADFLAASTYIDFDHPLVMAKAQQLADGCSDQHALIQRCFEFVRDEIHHSWDFQLNPVTCKASEVLQYSTGYCYAKSHLLAALLRANGIASGLCYQRLSVNENGARYCLHGLNAVWLGEYGWYRLDARGNKAGINAAYTPPQEQLAFRLADPQEFDLDEVWPIPLPVVIDVLTQSTTIHEVMQHLPDVERRSIQ
ncbi:transglutaminase-like domain-containing protein [Ampullimonas aquatilis]|uniref:transglutaminase-like domain-containing protein n=1 Tax=Ampullimonas aquatilis TaxID=1341549 RepID=UPI003C71BAF3